jgi:hypothetical protein
MPEPGGSLGNIAMNVQDADHEENAPLMDERDSAEKKKKESCCCCIS